MKPRVRIAITGGGTGGHLSPAVAIIEALQSGDQGQAPELLYIGSRDGAESRVIPLMGILYIAVSVGKLRRYFSLANFLDLLRVPLGVLQAVVQLARYRPHALLATGGYVSVPAVIAAWLLRRPVLVHEQTGSLGLANRINVRFATAVALSVPGSERAVRGRRWVLTGNPLRGVVRNGSRERGLRRFGLDGGLPVLYVTGGAQGAHAINEAVAEALVPLLTVTQVIHQCGDAAGVQADYEVLGRMATELPERLKARYVLHRYIGQEIGDVYAASDLVVGRAGAGTVNELGALGKPALLIPLPHAAGDEQRHNARRLVEAGSAAVLEQQDLTPDRLVREVTALLGDRERLAAMGAAGRHAGHGDAAQRIAGLLLELAGNGR